MGARPRLEAYCHLPRGVSGQGVDIVPDRLGSRVPGCGAVFPAPNPCVSKAAARADIDYRVPVWANGVGVPGVIALQAHEARPGVGVVPDYRQRPAIHPEAKLGPLDHQSDLVPDPDLAGHAVDQLLLQKLHPPRCVHLGDGRPEVLRPVLLAGAGKVGHVVMLGIPGTKDQPGAAVLDVPAEVELRLEVGIGTAGVESQVLVGRLPGRGHHSLAALLPVPSDVLPLVLAEAQRLEFRRGWAGKGAAGPCQQQEQAEGRQQPGSILPGNGTQGDSSWRHDSLSLGLPAGTHWHPALGDPMPGLRQLEHFPKPLLQRLPRPAISRAPERAAVSNREPDISPITPGRRGLGPSRRRRRKPGFPRPAVRAASSGWRAAATRGGCPAVGARSQRPMRAVASV